MCIRDRCISNATDADRAVLANMAEVLGKLYDRDEAADILLSLIHIYVLYNSSGTVMIGGGLGYFISYETGSFLAQCINFPLQRNITFKSKGNLVFQAIWYLIAWVVISLVCNGFNNLWMPVAAVYVSPKVYNILVSVITGGVSMVIFFFVFKIIFPEEENRK